MGGVYGGKEERERQPRIPKHRVGGECGVELKHVGTRDMRYGDPLSCLSQLLT